MFYRYVCTECGASFVTNIGEVKECPACGSTKLDRWIKPPKEEKQ